MFWKKKKKRFNLYEDEIDYTDRIDEEADSDSAAEVNQDEDISDGVTEDAASYSGTGDDDLPRLKFELPGEEIFERLIVPLDSRLIRILGRLSRSEAISQSSKISH